MRSLAVKLTLAFLIVGLTGALLVALISARQTQRAFDTFVLQRYQLDLVEQVDGLLRAGGQLGRDSRRRRCRR